MLTCPYNLKIDPVVGLINELTKAINLDQDDITILTNKLNKFSEKYININNNNQSDLLSKLENFKRIKENLSKLFQCN